MKRHLILAFALLASSVALNAVNSLPDDDKSDNKNKTELNSVVKKTWEFYSAIKQPSADALANAGNYKFGQEAGYLYNQFMKIYVVREEVVPGDPTRRTVIRKPTIYNAVRSIEKQLNKELKSNKMTREQVAAEFTNVLKVAISAYDSESESFEDALQTNRKNATDLLSVFQNVKLTEISEKQAEEEIQETCEKICEVTGKYTAFIRPPFGVWKKNLDFEITMIPVSWNVDSRDWTTKNTDKIVKTVVKDVKEGDIILMHDIFDSSVQAALKIADILSGQGYEFVTVDELLLE